MERELFAQLLEVGRTLLEAFVAAQGDGDMGEEVEQIGRRLRRLKDGMRDDTCQSLANY